MKTKTRHVVILSVSAGAGHVRAAQALCAQAERIARMKERMREIAKPDAASAVLSIVSSALEKSRATGKKISR